MVRREDGYGQWFGRKLGGGCDGKRRETIEVFEIKREVGLLGWRSRGAGLRGWTNMVDPQPWTEALCLGCSLSKWYSLSKLLCRGLLTVGPWMAFWWGVKWKECPRKMQPNWPPAGCMASASRGSFSILSFGCGGARPVLRAPCFQPFSVLKSSMETQPQNQRKSKWDGCEVKRRGILNTRTVSNGRLFFNFLQHIVNSWQRENLRHRFYSEVLGQTWLSPSQMKVLHLLSLTALVLGFLLTFLNWIWTRNQQRDTKVPLLVTWNWSLVSTVA